MKTRGLGGSIMAVGVVCLIFYTLALWRSSTFNVGVGNILFYTGVVALILGFILLLTAEIKRRRE